MRSTSRIPTLVVGEEFRSERANCADTDDLPTPPFPEHTMMMCLTCWSRLATGVSAVEVMAEVSLAMVHTTLDKDDKPTWESICACCLRWCKAGANTRVRVLSCHASCHHGPSRFAFPSSSWVIYQVTIASYIHRPYRQVVSVRERSIEQQKTFSSS